jgi:ABC-type hemin transport system ATPase subunit
MEKIRACVSDVLAIANSVAAQDLSQAKRRLELLFADVGCRAGASSGTVQNVRDQLARALDQSHSPTAKRFLDELIAWLDREHLGRGT